jgi:hypothetical protein
MDHYRDRLRQILSSVRKVEIIRVLPYYINYSEKL